MSGEGAQQQPQPTDGARSGEAEQHPQAVETPINLLLVERDMPTAELRARIFKLLGCEVLTVSTLDEALAQIPSIKEFDVVLTDIRLHEDADDRSGIHFAREAKRTHPHIPIVAYAPRGKTIARSDHPEISRWLSKGASNCAEVEETLQEVIDIGRQARRRAEGC